MAPPNFLKFFPLDFGSALLGGFFQAFFDRIMPHNLPRIIVREHELVSELNKWCTKLPMIQAVLRDAEEKQWTNTAVKVWLDDLRDFAYDLEDILDEYATKILERKLTASPSDDIISITTEEFNILLDNLRTMSNSGVMSDRLKELCERIGLLELMERTVGGTSSSAAVWQRPPSTFVPVKPAVYGRDDDKIKILEMMSRVESSVANFRVVSIVGMAGVGKTTLAQLVYNDSQLTGFERKAWVCISNDVDVFRISMAILESVTHSSYNLKNLNEVLFQLQLAVARKRFLLVLDDVWSKNYDLWETLISPLASGAQGSIIIVTTRNVDVALTAGGPSDYYDLKLLSDDDCWSVFTMHAFEDIEEHSNLEAVREKVVTKCGGLPLAARTLGGLLRSKERNDEWEDILNSKIWDLPAESNILPALKLSYYHLPAHLKRCLAYCAILPKNYEFEEKELVLLWMAEGFILPSANNKQLEDIGSEYFHDLLSRSIFQKSSGNTSKFVMHNLVNDLAEWILGETVLKMEDETKANSQAIRFQRARHSSYMCNDFDGKSKVEVLKKVESLRTILSIPIQNRDCFITNSDLFDLLSKFKKLRVLSLRRYRINELPNNSLESLRYLRYLNLSDTRLTSLPQSIGSLYNLQVLLLKNCSLLVELPFFMGNLINLLHLDISGACLISEMPGGMEKLEYLQTLSDFIVSGQMEPRSSLKELKNMKFLRGELRVSSLQNVINLEELKLAILSDKKNLQVLILEWGLEFDNRSGNENTEYNVLDLLRPHTNLTKLVIKHYGGTEFPYWVGDPSFSNMVDLRLEGCKKCTSLPPLGLLGSLKSLVIIGMTQLRAIDSAFYGEGCSKPFRSLKTLRLENLQEWETWDSIDGNEDVEIFHCLRELSIINCPLLSRRLPECLPSLQKLVIRQCAALVVPFSSFPELREVEIDAIRREMDQNIAPEPILKVEQLKVKNCPWLSSFLEVFLLSNLRTLEIEGCSGLTSLQTVMEQSTRLRRLKIEDCSSLNFIVRGHLPSSLKRLEIHNCEHLRHVAILDVDAGTSSENIDHINVSLEYLYISDCISLTTLVSRGELPETLKYLDIKNCRVLNTLSLGGQLPVSLERLVINRCGISSIPIGRHNLGIIREIEVSYCNNLVSFLQEGLPVTSLRKFSVSYCGNLDSSPSSLQGFNSLQELHVFNCPSIIAFQPSGLPINLTSLKIEGDALYNSLVVWGLHRLTTLRKLDISGGSSDICFPRQGMMLPASLNYLSLANFSGLSSLDSQGFQNLASLEYFTISNCRSTLKNFPEVLPSSLLKLEIIQCSRRLKHIVSTVDGKRRANIENIPFVKIDGEFIYTN